MYKQLTAYITAQDAILAALYTKKNSGGDRENRNKKKARTGLHVSANCKREIHHK